MEKIVNYFWQNPLVKICVISVLALLMLIPLVMIRNQVDDRSDYHSKALKDITKNWGGAQTFTGPWISYQYQELNDKKVLTVEEGLYPDSLRYTVNSVSQVLHRSIYDVPVYTADLAIDGNFVLNDKLPGIGKGKLILSLSDLKGLQGKPLFSLGGKELKISSGDKGIVAEINLEKGASEGDIIPFHVTMKVNGSEWIYFTPAGSMTEVDMVSDYPDPSFSGDFLPVEREVSKDGFTAKWQISQLTLASPSSSSFGVRLVKPVTQYRQTERALKYGILIIFLIFIAGFVVEMVSKKPINLIQYIVIGASLVLFYSLLLAFSDFLSFGLSYLIAAVMTTVALGTYFAGIVKNRWSIMLTGLVALAYCVIYVLLQMETFAFLTGTLLLFLILCVIMLLTRNLRIESPKFRRKGLDESSEELK